MLIQQCIFAAVTHVAQLAVFLPVLALVITELTSLEMMAELKKGIDELLWGDTGCFSFRGKNDAEKTDLEFGDAVVCGPSWFVEEHPETEVWRREVGFVDNADFHLMKTAVAGEVRCAASNRRPREDEAILACGLGLSFASFLSPSSIQKFIFDCAKLPSQGQNKVLREGCTSVFPNLATFLKKWTVFDEITFFLEEYSIEEESRKDTGKETSSTVGMEKQELASEIEQQDSGGDDVDVDVDVDEDVDEDWSDAPALDVRRMRLRLPIDMPAMIKSYPSLAQVLGFVERIHVRVLPASSEPHFEPETGAETEEAGGGSEVTECHYYHYS